MRGLQIEIEKYEYQNYIKSFDWSYFFTLTTGFSLSLKSARRLVQRWFDKFGNGKFLVFWCGEKNECSDGYHVHGLLSIPKEMQDSLDKYILGEFWDMVCGRKSRSNFRRYNNKKGAGSYCAKYIFKKSADYEFINEATSEECKIYDRMKYGKW